MNRTFEIFNANLFNIYFLSKISLQHDVKKCNFCLNRIGVCRVYCKTGIILTEIFGTEGFKKLVLKVTYALNNSYILQ